MFFISQATLSHCSLHCCISLTFSSVGHNPQLPVKQIVLHLSAPPAWAVMCLTSQADTTRLLRESCGLWGLKREMCGEYCVKLFTKACYTVRKSSSFATTLTTFYRIIANYCNFMESFTEDL